MSLWPHQEKCIQEILQAIGDGYKRILVTSPTGGGKTRIATELISRSGRKAILYTNRKLLVSQTSRVLAGAGISHGVRAAGYEDERKLDIQVSSMMTENARVLKKGTWSHHDAQLVIVDEAHLQRGKVARKMLDKHVEEDGACVVGLTATPLDLGDMYDHLVVAGLNSKLRACGALVPCYHYGPDEPDMKGIKAELGKDLSEKEQVKAIMRNGIFGRVLTHFQKINPEHKPTILFAPGVAESIWFAEQFMAAGISAAHIDGQDVWINGRIEKSSQETRDDVLARSRDGSIKVLCNRFVLREGIDAPWLAHGILATVFGSLQSYLQAGGRLLRAFPDHPLVTIQDHGGNWHRHGSLNADREWALEYTSKMVAGLRDNRLRKKICQRCQALLTGPICIKCGKVDEVEPVRCPQCGLILTRPVCKCGYEIKGERSRPVIQSDGTLKEMTGDIYRPRSVSRRTDGPEIWKRCYYRCKNTGKTFRQAEGLFAAENNYQWPDHTWPLMPMNELDWFRKVSDVPRERLK